MQRGHAPCGELKEKIRGSSSGIDVPQFRQENFSEKTSVPADSRTPFAPVRMRLGRRPSALRPPARPPRCPRPAPRPSPPSRPAACARRASSAAGPRPPRCRACTSCRARSRPRAGAARRRSSRACSPRRAAPRAGPCTRPCGPRTTGASTMNRVPSVERHHVVDDLLHRLARDRRAAAVAVGMADPRPQQAQVVVDLGDRADRRPRVPRGGLLVDRDRRRQPLDRVDVGLVHLAQELPRVGRQRLDVAALALGVDRVEGKARLTGPGEPGDDDQGVARQLEGDVLEIVLARTRDADAVIGGDSSILGRASSPALESPGSRL